MDWVEVFWKRDEDLFITGPYLILQSWETSLCTQSMGSGCLGYSWYIILTSKKNLQGNISSCRPKHDVSDYTLHLSCSVFRLLSTMCNSFTLFPFQLFQWKVVAYIHPLFSVGQPHPILHCVTLLIVFLCSHLCPLVLWCLCFQIMEFPPCCGCYLVHF